MLCNHIQFIDCPSSGASSLRISRLWWFSSLCASFPPPATLASQCHKSQAHCGLSRSQALIRGLCVQLLHQGVEVPLDANDLKASPIQIESLAADYLTESNTLVSFILCKSFQDNWIGIWCFESALESLRRSHKAKDDHRILARTLLSIWHQWTEQDLLVASSLINSANSGVCIREWRASSPLVCYW